MIPEREDLATPEKKPQPSASVFIKYRLNADGKPPLSPDDIRKFVASAVGRDLQPSNVSVIMTAAQPPSADVPASRLQDVLGFRMTASSAGTFRLMVGIITAIVLGMAGFTTWNFLRGPGSTSLTGTRRRTAGKPEA
jgi:type III secretion protein J